LTLAVAVLIAVAAPAWPAAPGDEGEPDKDYYLRGVGLLILDPRDPPELVKERMRLFLEQVRPNVPAELRQESNRPQIDALLAGDWESGDELPQLDLSFHPDMTVDLIHQFVEITPVARESAGTCPVACPFRDHSGADIHIHLTRPTRGGGDSIIIFHLYNPDGSEPASRQQHINQTAAMGQGISDRYGDYGYDRKPMTKLFGVGVVVGDPLVGREMRGQEPDVND
jgi:hypothetical protein